MKDQGKELVILKHFVEFTDALLDQLITDNKRWGDTFLNRPRDGQEERIRATYNNYFDKSKYAKHSMPWLKVIGNAYIAWLREEHPEMSPLWEDEE